MTAPALKVVSTRAELAKALPGTGEVGLVMTMGALHSGHLSLVEQLKEKVDYVVVTIFVNPAQFGAGEDLDSYPRSLASDTRLLEEVGASVLYAPSVQEVYPVEPRVTIQPGLAGEILEGYLRPGHFAGVLQVVGKMINLVRPKVAIFGQKDAQQFVNITQMVADLDQQVELIEAPIVRSESGLALSSRNAYLDDRQLDQATALHLSLVAGAGAADAGGDSAVIVAATSAVLELAEGVQAEYVALADAQSFDIFALWTPGADRLGVETIVTPNPVPAAAYLLVAARVGPARLIDNVKLEVAR